MTSETRIFLTPKNKYKLMKAIAIVPGKGDVSLITVEEPVISSPDEVKLEVLEVGICGTDREEVEGGRADPPAGENRLIIGHEMLGRVVDTGNKPRKVKVGDYALFMVRRPCNHCGPCHQERSDMCSTGDYTERGIKGRHGFQAQYVVDNEEFLIPVNESVADIGVLTEPMSVVVKAIDESVALQMARMPGNDIANWLRGKRALVAGLGPIGLLASFLLKLRGAEVFGLDVVDESSPRASILKKMGGEYINGKSVKTTSIDEKFGNMDFIFEATGIANLEFELMDALGMNGLYVLTGIPSGERPVRIAGNLLMRQMVLQNQMMLGSVNASKKHYTDAVTELMNIKAKFGDSIKELITERVNYVDFKKAFSSNSTDEIKTVIEWKKMG
jgi:threonine dehydrogenase-like Zn-dependent dehydrogenase